MGETLYPLLRIGGISCLVLFATGFSTQLVAVNRIRHEFRDKGFLRTPSGWEWVNFLRRKHYDLFKDSIARFFFTISRLCLIGMSLVVTVAVLLVGFTLVLGAFS